jgi:FAD synthase
MEVSFLQLMRPEQKFENQDALCAQIHNDIGLVRARLQNSKAEA